MPTKFNKIYERALFKFTDYSFLSAISVVKEEVMQKYLLAAVADFQHISSIDITKYDTDIEEFEEVLGNEEIEILALGIVYYWLSPQVYNKELLKNRIHNSDYTSYSPANLLKEIRSLKSDLEDEYFGKIAVYSYRHGNIDSLKT